MNLKNRINKVQNNFKNSKLITFSITILYIFSIYPGLTQYILVLIKKYYYQIVHFQKLFILIIHKLYKNYI